MTTEMEHRVDNNTPNYNSTPVGPAEDRVQSIFSAVAPRYDLANDVMTLGLARRWRQQLVSWSEASPGQQILDVATGTGDLAFLFETQVAPGGRVTAVDFCEPMILKAKEKASNRASKVRFFLANALELPFPDHQFDVVAIAYGIRNVADPQLALQEMARVTKPGGCVLILETGDEQSSWLRAGYKIYAKHIMPRIGGWMTGKQDAYEYLNQSSAAFPSRDNFLALLKTAKFSSAKCRPVLGGASFLYKATV